MQIVKSEQAIRSYLETRHKAYELVGGEIMRVIGRTLERLSARETDFYVYQLIEFINRVSNDENETKNLLSMAHYDPRYAFHPYVTVVEGQKLDEIFLYAATWKSAPLCIEYVKRYRALSAVSAVNLRRDFEAVQAIRITSSENNLTARFFPVKCVLTYNGISSKTIMLHAPDILFTLDEERLSTDTLTITCSSVNDPDALMCIDYLGVMKIDKGVNLEDYQARGFVRNCFEI